MRKFLIFILIFTGLIQAQSQNSSFETFYEKSGFKETPRYDKVIRYCKQLSDASPMVHYSSFGISAQGREIPLLIIDKKGNFDPKQVHASKNAVVLIQACIHAGEPDGKDAGLMLIRDMVIHKKYDDILDNVTILFIPIFNVDGHERFGAFNRINQNGPKEMGWRTNAQNLNLNRDYLKADAPEIQAWLSLFTDWLPDLFIDCHVTDGADYQYALTYAMEIYGTMDEGLTEWQKGSFQKELEIKMAAAKIPIFPYIEFRNWHDPRSGLETGAAPPMLAGGYCAIQNRPAVLIETHMLKDYQTRVTATYEMLKGMLEIVNKDYSKLIKLVQQADELTASQKFRESPLPVSFELSDKDSTMVTFKGVDYKAEPSALSGGLWFQYSKTPKDFIIPFFNTIKPKTRINLPEAYIIPPEWKAVIDRLKMHGIKTSVLNQETRIPVSSYRFIRPKWTAKSYEGHQTVETDVEPVTEERIYPAGSVVVEMNQRTAKVVAYLLEPQASTSLVYWGFFNAVMEQKEYAESYVMEEMARKMILENPGLMKELEEKKAADPKFAASSWDILNWFYSKSPYMDNKMNLYPVGKITDRNVLNSLLKNQTY